MRSARGHFHLADPRVVEGAQALLTAAIEASREGFGRMGGLGGGVGHAVEGLRETETAQVACAVRQLLHRAPRHRHAMHLGVSALGCGEVDELAIGGERGRIGNQIPLGGQVRHVAARGGHAIEIHRRAVLLLRLDDLCEALAAAEDQRAAVGRPCRRIVLEAVIGEAAHLALQVDGPEVGAFVGVLVALVRIGDQGEGRGIGTPGRLARIHAELGQLTGRAAVARHHVEFGGRGGAGSRGSGR